MGELLKDRRVYYHDYSVFKPTNEVCQALLHIGYNVHHDHILFDAATRKEQQEDGTLFICTSGLHLFVDENGWRIVEGKMKMQTKKERVPFRKLLFRD